MYYYVSMCSKETSYNVIKKKKTMYYYVAMCFKKN